MLKSNILKLISILAFAMVYSCKSDPNPIDPILDQKLLLIENEAQALNVGDEVQLSAVLIDVLGQKTTPSVSWSVEPAKIASITSSGKLVAKEEGEGFIKASFSEPGKSYSTEIPIIVKGVSLFDVVPGAIIWGLNQGTIELIPVYFGNQNPEFSFNSSDNSIASVNENGVVSFNGLGSCIITVGSNLPGEPSVKVPVLIVGEPEIELPVSRISIEPKVVDLFRLETQQFTAKAFNANGDEVATSFEWSVENPFDEDLQAEKNVISVNENGLVTAKGLGVATLSVVGNGVYGRSKVIVNPDTLIIVEPVYTMIAPGKSKQLTATPYKLNHDKSLTEITDPVNYSWVEFGDFLDQFTVSEGGLVTVKTEAAIGNLVSVLAIPESSTINLGMSLVIVMAGSDCNCGDKLANATSIGVNNETIDLAISAGQTAQINGTVKDATGTTISEALIKFCSSSNTVVAVDEEGNVTPLTPGSATITVCHGELTKEVEVTVTF